MLFWIDVSSPLFVKSPTQIRNIYANLNLIGKLFSIFQLLYIDIIISTTCVLVIKNNYSATKWKIQRLYSYIILNVDCSLRSYIAIWMCVLWLSYIIIMPSTLHSIYHFWLVLLVEIGMSGCGRINQRPHDAQSATAEWKASYYLQALC